MDNEDVGYSYCHDDSSPIYEQNQPGFIFQRRWITLKKQISDSLTNSIEEDRKADDGIFDYRFHDALESVLAMMEELELTNKNCFSFEEIDNKSS